jgi:Flp pilus assembly protein TadB
MSPSKRYIITSLIGLAVLWITYWLGLWPIVVMIFPFVWGGIYKLLVSYEKKRRTYHDTQGPLQEDGS